MFSEQTATVALYSINPLNAELNPIRHLLALVGARHIVHVSRIRVNTLVYITEVEGVYSAVRTESLYKTDTFNL